MNFFKSGFPLSICISSRRAAAVLAATLGMLLICLPLFSQGSYGRILGAVTDQTGGVIAGATVTILDVDRGISRTLTSDDAGEYNAPNLEPGKYTVRAEAKGFKTVERQNVILEVGKEPRVDLSLQPGEQTQTITVTESIPLVETTNATLGGTLGNADIVDLPLNGRDYQNLLGLRPGVLLMVGGGPWTQSTNNIRPDESVWMIEGVFNSNPFDARPVVNMPSPFTDGATILPVDAIQEFNTMENPKAEYGWKAGAVVNVGIKSGTNQLHGAAYGFGRYDGWDARNYYNVGSVNNFCTLTQAPNTPTFAKAYAACDKFPAQLKQFGGVVGGPIKKDKLFFFAGYEGLRSYIAPAAGLSSPAIGSLADAGNCPAGATGDCANSLVDAINGVHQAGLPVSQVSLSSFCPNAIGQGLPLPANFLCQSPLLDVSVPATSSTISAYPITNQSDNGIGKLDWHANDKNEIHGVFFLGKYFATGEDHPFNSSVYNDSVPISAWTVTTSWVYTPSSSWVNEARFGYTRTVFDFVNLDVHKPANGTSSGYLLNTGVTDPLTGGFPNINAGFGPFLGGVNNRPQYFSPNPLYNFQDGISYLRGKHSFKFGGEVAHMESDSAVYAGGRGIFNFNGGAAFGGSTKLEDFFAGTPSGPPYAGQVLAGNPALKVTYMMAAGYVQDDWRVTQKLIVNLGLRYEYFTPFKEASGLLGNFDPNLGMVQQGRGIDRLYNGDHRGFGPRIGFAYDVTGRGTTVVRGGVSIIRSSLVPLDFLAPFGLENNTLTSSAAIPTAAPITCGALATVGESVCPATSGGTIKLGSVNYQGSALCWDPTVPSGPGRTPACIGGQKTVFPQVSASCGDGINGAPAPCDLFAVDRNLKSPFLLNYNLSIQHQIGANRSLEVSYVGNHGYRLLSFTDINQAPLGASYCRNSPLTPAQLADACGPSGTGSALQEARPFFTKFPYIGFINYASNKSSSSYNSLQVTLTQRMSHGLSFTGGYTFAHSLDNGSLNRFGGLPQDSNNLRAERASADLDARHRLSVTTTYDIPGIKGFAQLLEGWEINAIVSYQSPLPWMAADGIKPGPPGDNFNGTGEQSDRWNITGPASSFPSDKISIPWCGGFAVGPGNTVDPSGASCQYANAYSPGGGVTSGINQAAAIAGCAANAADPNTLAAAGCYASWDGKAFLTPNALGHYGNMGRNIFRDSGFKNLDMSIFKNFKIRERYGIQARWEVFNVFNHPTAANPYGAGGFVNANNLLNGSPVFGSALATPDFIAGNPLIGSGSQRVMQLGLKLTF
jgi:Carboxypeptidase regulatory-like domain